MRWGVPHRNFRKKQTRVGMNTVKIKAYAKVNLTLEIKGIEGGYHLLDSVVASVDVFDLVVLKKRKEKLSRILMKGMGSEGIPPEKNTALLAAERFSEKFQTGGVDITVYKNIPMGAGLGGSSADVAGVLNGMALLYGIEDRAALKEIADSIGSDTGYMLTGGFARMEGRGEKVTPLGVDRKLHFLLLCPPVEVSAGACYKKYDELPKTLEWKESYSENCIKALLENDINGVGRYLTNDLYIPALHLQPVVEKTFEEGLSFSPLGVTMTGSGSCVLAMFETKELCEWAKSRYKGNAKTIVCSTVIPDYGRKKKGLFRNPFVLSDEEISETE